VQFEFEFELINVIIELNNYALTYTFEYFTMIF